ncbi:MAG: molybdenum cofactor biosynthesis enzyme, partial [uncultured archaeon A07HN63]
MDGPLEDEFGREVTGVRVSLTDRCNFDCVYCHNEGLGDTRGPMEPDDNEMTADDVVRFLEVVAEFGVGKVKFTGGEPMLRQDLEAIIRRTPDSI